MADTTIRSNHSPKVAALRVRAVRVPMAEPHQTASGVVAESPLVLTGAVCDDGTVGHGVVFTYTPMALQPVAALIRNFEPLVVEHGLTNVAGALGTRVDWNEAAVERFSV